MEAFLLHRQANNVHMSCDSSTNALAHLLPPSFTPAAACEGKSGCHKPSNKRCHKSDYHCVDG